MELTSIPTWLSLISPWIGSKLVSNSTATKEPCGSRAGSGRPKKPLEKDKESALEVIKKAKPSPKGQEGEEMMVKEKRQEKEAVVLVEGSRNLIG